jgi:hypothetical protein
LYLFSSFVPVDEVELGVVVYVVVCVGVVSVVGVVFIAEGLNVL